MKMSLISGGLKQQEETPAELSLIDRQSYFKPSCIWGKTSEHRALKSRPHAAAARQNMMRKFHIYVLNRFKCRKVNILKGRNVSSDIHRTWSKSFSKGHSRHTDAFPAFMMKIFQLCSCYQVSSPKSRLFNLSLFPLLSHCSYSYRFKTSSFAILVFWSQK